MLFYESEVGAEGDGLFDVRGGEGVVREEEGDFVGGGEGRD